MESPKPNITLYSILSAFLSRRGLRAKDEKLVPFDVIMPTLIMDVCYTICDEYIQPDKFIHAERRYARLVNQYMTFYFHDFWHIWTNDDEQDFLVELMDDFREYIHTHVEIIANVVWTKLERYDGPDRELLSRIMLCNILSQAAGMIHDHVFGRVNESIVKVSFNSYRLMNAIGDKHRITGRNIDLNTFKDVRDAVTNLIHKIKEFKEKC